MFIVEVGERQVWPFLTFCDNRTTPPTEIRLYIDTDYSVDGSGDLAGLMMREVSAARVDGAALRLELTDASLVVSGRANNQTSHDVWWLASA